MLQYVTAETLTMKRQSPRSSATNFGGFVIVSSHEDYRRLITAHQDPDCQDHSEGRSADHSC